MPRTLSPKHRRSRWATGLVALALGAASLTSCDRADPAPSADPGPQAFRPDRPPDAGPAPGRVHAPLPVSANRGADVPPGFRGVVHPVLAGRTQLDVTATWTPIEKGQLKLEFSDEIREWFTSLRPAVPRTTYTARDFSPFLPESLTAVGQVWALDPDRVQAFLAQFHPRPRLHLTATGRRAGPDGAFALLRAVSPSHAEIVFRIHAEFHVTPPVGGDLQSVYAWLTPAYFHGRLVVNKAKGTVEYFQLALPTDKALNVFLTVNPSLLNIPKLGHDIIRVDRMELAGGDRRVADNVSWAESIPPAEAARRLAKVFYKFEEIDWVPVDQALAKARSQNRPIFAIVSWGSTDDQSC
jgi:hypothetical protein